MPQVPDFRFDVFLSHNHADKPRVRRLAERLKAAGVRVWGRPKVEGGRMKAELPIHPSSLILHPLHAGRRFIPLLLGDCALPDTLRRCKVVDFREESEAAFAAPHHSSSASKRHGHDSHRPSGNRAMRVHRRVEVQYAASK